ncbi:MAG: hypothetical protein V4579_13920 [Pseudomonadota bacterium]
MIGSTQKRRLGAATLLLLAISLSACLLTPGRFTSALDVRRDGQFSFSYAGEIHLLALSKLAEATRKRTFTADKCHDAAMAERPCTAAELHKQRRAWEDQREAGNEKSRQEEETMKALLGGIDPSSPQAAEELAARLRRQAGWKSVVHQGDGLFTVDFAITGRVDHDFAFPTIERFPMANPFVQLTRRTDGTVRIEAPGFGAGPGGGNPLAAMMGGIGGMAGTNAPAVPRMDGTFTLTTDGAVLANNTDEGPRPDPSGQKLSWAINPRAAAAPTALVRLGP